MQRQHNTVEGTSGYIHIFNIWDTNAWRNVDRLPIPPSDLSFGGTQQACWGVRQLLDFLCQPGNNTLVPSLNTEHSRSTNIVPAFHLCSSSSETAAASPAAGDDTKAAPSATECGSNPGSAVPLRLLLLLLGPAPAAWAGPPDAGGPMLLVWLLAALPVRPSCCCCCWPCRKARTGDRLGGYVPVLGPWLLLEASATAAGSTSLRTLSKSSSSSWMSLWAGMGWLVGRAAAAKVGNGWDPTRLLAPSPPAAAATPASQCCRGPAGLPAGLPPPPPPAGGGGAAAGPPVPPGPCWLRPVGGPGCACAPPSRAAARSAALQQQQQCWQLPLRMCCAVHVMDSAMAGQPHSVVAVLTGSVTLRMHVDSAVCSAFTSPHAQPVGTWARR